MKTFSRGIVLAVLGMGIGLVLPGSANRAAKVTGTGKWTVTAQNGNTYETTLKRKQEGQRLTGTITGRQGNETEIEEGKVEKEEVGFKVIRELGGTKVVQKSKGKLGGETIKGQVEIERDGKTREREWESKRS